MYAVGLMSGTSLDGIDAVLCEINGSQKTTKVSMLAFDTYEIPEDIKLKIKKACDPMYSGVDLICSLNFELGELFAKSVKAICKQANFQLDQLDFVASHGQTIYHQPIADDTHVRSTLQIGEAAVIAYECQVDVISNFRVMDMAAKGEGAPLVPYSEQVLYQKENECIALQNIGGIGNVSVLPTEKSPLPLIAFDTGPGNMIIDEAMLQLYGKPYDENGQTAALGKVNEAMLKELMAHPYILQVPKKTTGREMFGQSFTLDVLKRYKALPKEDIVATVTMFTAKSIAVNYKQFLLPDYPIKKLIVGGGGAYNQTLMRFIQEELPQLEVLTQESLGFSSAAKEAIAFVVMGNETLHRQASNVISATGAQECVILGNITYGRKKAC
ncbi:anhydro-N-acetylmuramic acid kinase AnmK [Beduini massiliensis]|uniref:anhydro-N-acetylmuramic acid kinase AnmK n=1 Tax=Beduini massiliensis TaxID=1585974 RepID=UPI00059A8562|nr:anhydro-N-acetylmuramic acid kinase AnmK [Beduini massiliensis]